MSPLSARRQALRRKLHILPANGFFSHRLEPRRRALMMELERHYRSGESPTLQRLKSRTEEKLPEYTPRNAGPLWVDESKLEPGDSSEPDGVWLSMKYEIPRMLKRVRGRL